ncbi:MAG: rRNA maturation RNase YbeY [Porphyromonadaceae bacterium]|nr:MAG: rRNA maturation RNase YbeY [Porphyromonadaceae bacterium]
MSIHYLEEDRKATGFNRTVTKKWLHDIVRLEGKKPGVISYIFCSDEFLVDINIKFLKRDYYTDVISFDYTENEVISGDIMVSVDRVKENAVNMGVVYIEELKRIMVHGLLHLIGYKDSTKELKAIMSSREDFYLAMAKEEGK